MSDEMNYDRRRFLGSAAMTIAAAKLGRVDSAPAQASNAKPANPNPSRLGTNTSPGPIKQIDAGVLNVGYAEAGPADGPPVILLHGWPYDIHSLCRRRAIVGREGIPRNRALSARLRHNTFSFRRDGPQRPAVGACSRYHRL